MAVCDSLQLGLLLVHTLLAVGGDVESSYCSNGFPERDRLVSDVVRSNGPAIRLIPEMNFTCNGNITGFIFAGRMESGDFNPVIQIWRESNSQSGEYYLRTGADILINEMWCAFGFTEVFSGVFRCDILAQVSVQPGDVLGLELTPDNNSTIGLSFARVLKGPVNYVFSEEELQSSVTVILSNRTSKIQELPQIIIKVSEKECTRGFPNIPIFSEESIAQDSSIVTVLIPDMNFSCNQRIVAFTFTGINRRQEGQLDPMIQIWRENSSEPGTYYKTGRPIPVNTSTFVCADGLYAIASRSYFCILNKGYQISVQPGDILGLEIPPTSDFDILFTFSGGPTNFIFNNRLSSTVDISENTTTVPQLPQISFDFTSDQCTSGFPDTVSAEGSGQGDPSKVTTRLFPELKFGCSGKIVRFAVAVMNRYGQQSPKIQIWRPNDTQPCVYYKTGPDIPITGRSPACRRDLLYNAIFRCIVNEAFQISVQPGDILGLELPSENDDDLDIHFIEQGAMNYVFEERLISTVNLSEANRFTSHMPQINFVVVLDSNPPNEGERSNITTCNFSPVLLDSSVPTRSTTPLNTEKESASVIAGSVIGSSVVLLLLVGFVLALVCIRRHRKSKKSQDKPILTVTVDNDEACEVSNYIGIGDHMTSNKAYGISDIDDHMDENQAYRITNRIAGHDHIPVESNKAYGTSNHIGSDDHVESNKAYGVLSAHLTCTRQELGDGASQMYMYDYPITEIETQGRFPGPILNEPAVENDTYWEPANDVNELYQQLSANKYRDIKSSQIQIIQALGSGQFGTVSKGIWQSPMGAMDVAVKQLQHGASEEENVRFLQEAAINGQFRHPNVVKLMGVVSDEGPTMIVLELLSNGDLLNFLLNQRPSPGEAVPVGMQQMLLRFCQHVASGMSYLASKSFVHRDLAARNILVSEDKICKISDFGMSRDVESDKCYISKGGKIPVKWTAPEAIHYKKYSTASDVWSFGCVIYEIWSLGHEPFERFTNTETFRRVEMGYRLPPPPGLTKELYKIMIQCWKPESSRRPTFPQLVEMLSRADFELFAWEEDDLKDSDPQVKLIGAPLEVAQDLYPELQRSYTMQVIS